MQPRTLDQILGELNTVYEPQINSLRKQQSMIPQSIASETQGLQAKQGEAFDSILGGARQRGLGFSGIPLQEQAKYTSTEFLPALARLQQGGRQQAMSLEDAILGINERRQNSALGQRQYEQQRYDQQQQFERQLAESRRAAAAQAQQAQMTLGLQKQQQAQFDNRPSLASIFGMGGYAPPSLQVSNGSMGNILLPAGRVNPTPTYNSQPAGMNTGRSPVIQGGGAISGTLRVR